MLEKPLKKLSKIEKMATYKQIVYNKAQSWKYASMYSTS